MQVVPTLHTSRAYTIIIKRLSLRYEKLSDLSEYEKAEICLQEIKKLEAMLYEYGNLDQDLDCLQAGVGHSISRNNSNKTSHTTHNSHTVSIGASDGVSTSGKVYSNRLNSLFTTPESFIDAISEKLTNSSKQLIHKIESEKSGFAPSWSSRFSGGDLEGVSVVYISLTLLTLAIFTMR